MVYLDSDCVGWCEFKFDLLYGLVENGLEVGEHLLHECAEAGGLRVLQEVWYEWKCVEAYDFVDFFNIDEIACVWVDVALRGDLEFVVGSEAAHGRPGGESVFGWCVGGERAIL